MPDITVKQAPLYGRVIITGQIVAITGLHIGGNPAGIEIGGIDNIIIRNPITRIPYIPGSSLKGKMRSLYERYEQLPINHTIDQVSIHSCHVDTNLANYQKCNVCQIFGLPAEGNILATHPTPLIVRDVPLVAIGAQSIDNIDDFTEIKWEAVIDRITAQAVPRQVERVPEGSIFKSFELIYNIYSAALLQRLPQVFVALQLVEDDYLGGLGSRGSGKVRFTEIQVMCKRKDNGRYKIVAESEPYENLDKLLSDEAFLQGIEKQIPISSLQPKENETDVESKSTGDHGEAIGSPNSEV